MREGDAKRLTPRLIRAMQMMQEKGLEDFYKGILQLTDIPGFFMSDPKDQACFFHARVPEEGESPPVSGVVSVLSHFGASYGRVRVLRHAFQRWVKRGGGESLSDMIADIQSCYPFFGLILAQWPTGTIVVPSFRGVYLGELCEEKTDDGTVRRWIELWTFAEKAQMYHSPKVIRRRFFEEVLLSPEDRLTATRFTSRLLCGLSVENALHEAVLPILRRVDDLIQSDAWRKHLASRERSVLRKAEQDKEEEVEGGEIIPFPKVS